MYLLQLNIPHNVITLFNVSDVFIKVSEIGDDTNNDGSSTRHTLVVWLLFSIGRYYDK